MTEKREILKGIIGSGNSIVEACELADIETLRNEGEERLADLILDILKLVEKFAEEIGLYEEGIEDEIIAECDDEVEIPQ